LNEHTAHLNCQCKCIHLAKRKSLFNLTLLKHVSNDISFRPDDLLGSDGVSESNVFAYLADLEKVGLHNFFLILLLFL